MSDLAKRSIVGILLIGLALALLYLGGIAFAVFVAVLAALIFREWLGLVPSRPAWLLAGLAYAALPAAALIWLRGIPQGLAIVLWLLVVTWATDICAYFSGRAIGGPKLAPRISPNKTWAGLIGGVAAAALAGFLIARLYALGHGLAMLAAPLAVAAQAGDLFESWLKRRAGVKDSGNLLPGHGGIMDRLDGLVPVATLTACVVAFSGAR